MAKNVEININNGSSYEVLYPKADYSNMNGSLAITDTTGNLPSSRLSAGTLSGSFTFSSVPYCSSSPSSSYYLANKYYVDNHVAKRINGSYTGTGSLPLTITGVSFIPDIFCVVYAQYAPPGASVSVYTTYRGKISGTLTNGPKGVQVASTGNALSWFTFNMAPKDNTDLNVFTGGYINSSTCISGNFRVKFNGSTVVIGNTYDIDSYSATNPSSINTPTNSQINELLCNNSGTPYKWFAYKFNS